MDDEARGRHDPRHHDPDIDPIHERPFIDLEVTDTNINQVTAALPAGHVHRFGGTASTGQLKVLIREASDTVGHTARWVPITVGMRLRVIDGHVVQVHTP